MNLSLIVVFAMLVLSILAPFICLYAVKLARDKKYKEHIKFQQNLFYTCVTGVLILEFTIRISGGSGSLVKNSPYLETNFFKILLLLHIIGAVLTYIIWAFTIFKSRKKSKMNALSGTYSAMHKKLGYIVIIGLFYTGITAFVVCLMAFLPNLFY